MKLKHHSLFWGQENIEPYCSATVVRKGKGHQQARKVDRPKATAEKLRTIAENCEIAEYCEKLLTSITPPPPLVAWGPSGRATASVRATKSLRVCSAGRGTLSLLSGPGPARDQSDIRPGHRVKRHAPVQTRPAAVHLSGPACLGYQPHETPAEGSGKDSRGL